MAQSMQGPLLYAYLNPELAVNPGITDVDSIAGYMDSQGIPYPSSLPPDFNAKAYILAAAAAGTVPLSSINQIILQAMLANGYSPESLADLAEVVPILQEQAVLAGNAGGVLLLHQRDTPLSDNIVVLNDVLVIRHNASATSQAFTVTDCDYQAATITLQQNFTTSFLLDDPASDYTILGVRVYDVERLARICAQRFVFDPFTTPPPNSFNYELYRLLYPDVRYMTPEQAYQDWLASNGARCGSIVELIDLASTSIIPGPAETTTVDGSGQVVTVPATSLSAVDRAAFYGALESGEINLNKLNLAGVLLTYVSRDDQRKAADAPGGHGLITERAAKSYVERYFESHADMFSLRVRERSEFTGSAIFHGPVELTSNVNVQGMFFANGGLRVSGGTTYTEDVQAISLQVSGPANVQGRLTASNGANVSGGSGLHIQGPEGVLVSQGGSIAITGGGGVVVEGGGTINVDGTVTVNYGGIMVNAGQTELRGGLLVSGATGTELHNGLDVQGDTVLEDGDLTLLTGDIIVTSGGIIVGGANSNGISVSQGGITVADGGITIEDGGLTVESGGARVVLGGLSVEGGGVFVQDNGITVQDGGIVVQSGGIAVAQDGIVVFKGGATVWDGGISVHDGGITVDTDGIFVTQGDINVADGSIKVSNGLLVQSGGLQVEQGGLVVGASSVSTLLGGAHIGGSGLTVTSGKLVVSGDQGLEVQSGGINILTGLTFVGDGLDVSGTAVFHDQLIATSDVHLQQGGRLVTDAGCTTELRGSVNIQNGAIVDGGLLDVKAGIRVTGGADVTQGGLRVRQGGMKVDAMGACIAQGDLVIQDGDIQCAGRVNVGGDFSCAGELRIAGGAVVADEDGMVVSGRQGLVISGPLVVDGDCTFPAGASIAFKGTPTLSNGLNVAGGSVVFGAHAPAPQYRNGLTVDGGALQVSSDAFFYDDVVCDGNVYIRGSIAHEGDTTFWGHTEFNGNSGVLFNNGVVVASKSNQPFSCYTPALYGNGLTVTTGMLVAEDGARFAKGAHFEKGLTATGRVWVHSNLDVWGWTTIHGSALEVWPRAGFCNGLVSLDEAGITTCNLTVLERFDVDGQTVFSGEVNLRGATKVQGNALFTGKSRFNGSLTAFGKTELAGGLTVNGSNLSKFTTPVQFADDIQADGHVTVESLDVSTVTRLYGPTNVNNTLDCEGNAVFSAPVTFEDDVSFRDSIDIHGPLYVDGTTTFYSTPYFAEGATITTASIAELELGSELVLSHGLRVEGETELFGQLQAKAGLNTDNLLVTDQAIFKRGLTVQGNALIAQAPIVAQDGIRVTSGRVYIENAAGLELAPSASAVLRGGAQVGAILAADDIQVHRLSASSLVVKSSELIANAGAHVNGLLRADEAIVYNGLTVSDGPVVVQDLNVQQDAHVEGESTFERLATFDRGFLVPGVMTTYDDKVDVLAPIHMRSNLTVEAEAEFRAKTVFQNSLVTNSSITAHSVATFLAPVDFQSTVQARGPITAEDVHVKGSLRVDKSIHLGDNLLIDSNLTVLGKTRLAGGLHLDGNPRVNTLDVCIPMVTYSSVNLRNGLAVTRGMTEFSSNVEFKGHVKFDGTAVFNDFRVENDTELVRLKSVWAECVELAVGGHAMAPRIGIGPVGMGQQLPTGMSNTWPWPPPVLPSTLPTLPTSWSNSHLACCNIAWGWSNPHTTGNNTSVIPDHECECDDENDTVPGYVIVGNVDDPLNLHVWGNVTALTIAGLSDQRLKHSIKDVDDLQILSKLGNLKLSHYGLTGVDQSASRIGFIAQHLLETLGSSFGDLGSAITGRYHGDETKKAIARDVNIPCSVTYLEGSENMLTLCGGKTAGILSEGQVLVLEQRGVVARVNVLWTDKTGRCAGFSSKEAEKGEWVLKQIEVEKALTVDYGSVATLALASCAAIVRYLSRVN